MTAAFFKAAEPAPDTGMYIKIWYKEFLCFVAVFPCAAEKLVGNGDMLFKPQDLNKPKRIQGPFVSDEEVEKVIAYVKRQGGEAHYDEALTNHLEKGTAGGFDDDEDELIMDAIETVVDAGQASVSMLQRRFRIGYNRAARIIDALEARGIIGPADGSRPRQVLLSEEEFRQMKENL